MALKLHLFVGHKFWNSSWQSYLSVIINFQGRWGVIAWWIRHLLMAPRGRPGFTTWWRQQFINLKMYALFYSNKALKQLADEKGGGGDRTSYDLTGG